MDGLTPVVEEQDDKVILKFEEHDNIVEFYVRESDDRIQYRGSYGNAPVNLVAVTTEYKSDEAELITIADGWKNTIENINDPQELADTLDLYYGLVIGEEAERPEDWDK